MKRWKNEKTEKLFEAFAACKNAEEVANFCRDLMTLDEIKEFSKRFEIAQKLNEGLSQRTIAKDMKVSITTVTRVNKWLKSKEKGYRSVLNSLSHHHKPQVAGL